MNQEIEDFERGQSVALYRISQVAFDIISNDTSKFDITLIEECAFFKKNFQGIRFLLDKLTVDKNRELIQEIFYPTDYIGTPVDFDSRGFDELMFEHNGSIECLSREKINKIRIFLDSIDREILLYLYNGDELNRNEIYEDTWQSDKFPGRFNKQHIEQSFDKLLHLFRKADDNKDLILVFLEQGGI